MAFIEKPPPILELIKKAALERVRIHIQDNPEVPDDVAEYRPRTIQEDDVISSAEHNKELVALFESLRALYLQTDVLGSTLGRQDAVLKSAFREGKAGILKVINDIRVHTFLRKNIQYNDVRFVDFHTSRNHSTSVPLANVDTQSRVLKLPSQDSRPVELIGSSSGQASVRINHIGGGISGSLIQDFGPERILDRNETTFWADLILTSDPITQIYTTSKGVGRTSNGHISEVIVSLSEADTINTIRMLPFSEYPLIIIDLAFKNGSLDHWIPIEEFQETGPTLDWVEVQFSPVRAAEVRVTLLQENFIHGIYHLPERMVHATNLLEHAIADTYLDRIGVSSLDDSDIGRVTVSPELLAHIESLKEFDTLINAGPIPQERVREYELVQSLLNSVSKVLSRPNPLESLDLMEPIGILPEDRPEELLEVSTTEYLIGMSSFEALHVEYTPVGYYRTPAFNTIAVPIEISLEANESHVSLADDDGEYRLTSVEYNIDLGEGIILPLHPANHKVGVELSVKDEVIFVDRQTKKGFTRFLPNTGEIATVRVNGVRVPSTEYTFAPDLSRNQGDLEITSNYSPNSVYSISYAPTPSAAIIDVPTDVRPTKIRVPEIATGTDSNGRLDIQYVPYIEYEVINDEDNFINQTDGLWEYRPTNPASTVTIGGITYNSTNPNYEPIIITVNGVKAKNRTSYLSGEQPVFITDNLDTKVYQYFHMGRRVYFNRPLTETSISVEYSWLTQYAQVQITLRCFKQTGLDITPVIDNLTLRLKTSPL